MKITRILLGLLLLRRRTLPGLLFWVFRLGLWSIVLSAAVRVVRNRLGISSPASFPAHQSGWTMPAADATRSTETVSRFASEEVNIGTIMQQPDELQQDESTSTETPLYETKIVPPNDDETAGSPFEPDPDFQPRWVKGDGSSDCPIDFPIKAKASSLIYHSPESQHFLVTVPDVCFASIEDAEAAGYRAPKR